MTATVSSFRALSSVRPAWYCANRGQLFCYEAFSYHAKRWLKSCGHFRPCVNASFLFHLASRIFTFLVVLAPPSCASSSSSSLFLPSQLSLSDSPPLSFNSLSLPSMPHHFRTSPVLLSIFESRPLAEIACEVRSPSLWVGRPGGARRGWVGWSLNTNCDREKKTVYIYRCARSACPDRFFWFLSRYLIRSCKWISYHGSTIS